MRTLGAIALMFLPFCLAAQHAVDSAHRYFRVIALVHLTGSGKVDDPIRPEYVPTAGAHNRDGILAYSAELTDDKQMAIVHMAASNHHAFDAILNDKRAEVQVFEIGAQDRTVIETALRMVKKDFDLDQFQVVVQ